MQVYDLQKEFATYDGRNAYLSHIQKLLMGDDRFVAVESNVVNNDGAIECDITLSSPSAIVIARGVHIAYAKDSSAMLMQLLSHPGETMRQVVWYHIGREITPVIRGYQSE